MPLYVFQAKDGERIEIFAPMATPPKEIQRQKRNGRMKLFRRVFDVGGGVTIKGGSGVQYPREPLPVSKSLPFDARDGTVVQRGKHKVRLHEDGTMSTLDRSRIVRNSEDMKKHCAQAGCEHERTR